MWNQWHVVLCVVATTKVPGVLSMQLDLEDIDNDGIHIGEIGSNHALVGVHTTGV